MDVHDGDRWAMMFGDGSRASISKDPPVATECRKRKADYSQPSTGLCHNSDVKRLSFSTFFVL